MITGIKSNRTSAAAGFTLIELLVTVTIIAILVSVLLPTLTMVKQVALQVKCASNLRQIGMVGNLYSSDWDGQIAPTCINGTPWFGTLTNFMPADPAGGKLIRGCPTFKKHYASNGWELGYARSEYLMQARKVASENRWDHDMVGSMDANTGIWGRPFRRGAITHADQRILIGGAYDWYMQAGGWHCDNARHRMKENFLYCDGHVALLDNNQARGAITGWGF